MVPTRTRNMNLKLKLVIHLLVGVSLAVFKVNGLKCYVCGDDEELPCNNFEIEKERYSKECQPPIDKSCKTAAEDDKVLTRTCYNRYLNICNITANGVEYCFCSSDLCNGSIHTRKFINPTDDEDLLEGSGTKTVSTFTEKPNITVKVTSAVAKLCVSQIIFFISTVTLFIIH